MESTHMRRVDGTSALALTAPLEGEFEKDRWDVRSIPDLRLPKGKQQKHSSGVPIA